MAARRIRVYELARELGLSNKETLDLCAALGIGVKSHSSSIEEAQADRVRRKAEREGLKRDVQPEEPAPPKKATKKKAAAAAAPAPAQPAPEPAATPAEEPAPAARDTSRPPDPTHRLITSRPASEQPDLTAPRPAPAPPRPAPAPPGASAARARGSGRIGCAP